MKTLKIKYNFSSTYNVRWSDTRHLWNEFLNHDQMFKLNLSVQACVDSDIKLFPMYLLLQKIIELEKAEPSVCISSRLLSR